MEQVIQTNNITKVYGAKAAVNNISITVNKGDIYGLIGKNGAGKTTLMKLLLGLTAPNSGEIKLFESSNLFQERKKIGSLIEAPAFYKNLTAYENMKRFAILSPTSDEEIKKILALVHLSKTGSKKAGNFSLGMQQRLGIAIALLGKPKLLILDEPTNGLDPAGIKKIRDIILELNAQGVTFLISSHLLDELGKIANRYGIISNGVLLEEVTANELSQRFRTSLKLTVDNTQKATEILKQKNTEIQINCSDNILRILSPIEDSSVIVEQLVQSGIRLYEVTTENKSFEDFFIERLDN